MRCNNTRSNKMRMILFVLFSSITVLRSSSADAQSRSPDFGLPPSVSSDWMSRPMVVQEAATPVVAWSLASVVRSDVLVKADPDTAQRGTRWHRVALGAAIGGVVGVVAGALIGHNADRGCTGHICNSTATAAVALGFVGILVGGVLGDAWPAGDHERTTSRFVPRAGHMNLGIVRR